MVIGLSAAGRGPVYAAQSVLLLTALLRMTLLAPGALGPTRTSRSWKRPADLMRGRPSARDPGDTEGRSQQDPKT